MAGNKSGTRGPQKATKMTFFLPRLSTAQLILNTQISERIRRETHLTNPINGGVPDGHQIRPARLLRLLQQKLSVALHGQVILLPPKERLNAAL